MQKECRSSAMGPLRLQCARRAGTSPLPAIDKCSSHPSIMFGHWGGAAATALALFAIASSPIGT